ncbi:MAG: Panacea domain-containing protein [Candidatus Kryptoniota bacterium]
MSKLVDVLVYLLKNYPHKSELSNARLTKLVYLADWKFALKNKKQITGIQWEFNNFGPFVWDIYNCAKDNPSIFEIENTQNSFGHKKTLIKLSNENYPINIPIDEKNMLDFVINSTKQYDWNRFIQLVYSTFPILSSDRGDMLDLIELAYVKDKLKSQQKTD